MEGRASCMPYHQKDATFLFVKLENSFYSVAVACILVPSFRQSSHWEKVRISGERRLRRSRMGTP
jgi:hypothetical protein